MRNTTRTVALQVRQVLQTVTVTVTVSDKFDLIGHNLRNREKV